MFELLLYSLDGASLLNYFLINLHLVRVLASREISLENQVDVNNINDNKNIINNKFLFLSSMHLCKLCMFLKTKPTEQYDVVIEENNFFF